MWLYYTTKHHLKFTLQCFQRLNHCWPNY